jgi:MFS family permease
MAYPLLGVFAGVMVDRWLRKPVLVWSNILQFIALGSIPLAFFVGALSLYQLFIVTLVMGVTTVFFNIAYTAYLPTLIDREDLVEGNSKLETSASGGAVVGPSIAGTLVKAIGPLAIAADALGTLFAGAAILSIKKREPPPPRYANQHFWTELHEGVSSVARTPSLLGLATSTSILNLGNGMFLAVFYLFMYDRSIRMRDRIRGGRYCGTERLETHRVRRIVGGRSPDQRNRRTSRPSIHVRPRNAHPVGRVADRQRRHSNLQHQPS